MELFKIIFLSENNECIETLLYEENKSKAKEKALERLKKNKEYKELISVMIDKGTERI